MTETLKLNAENKPAAGTGSSRELRRNGKIPAIIYGGGKQDMLALNQREFNKEYFKGGIRTRLAEIILDGKVITAIAKDIQLDPLSDEPIHVDFIRVGKDTLIKLALTIKVVGEDKSPGVKKGGIVNIVHRTVDFMCHPSNIPHHIELDISKLEIGENIHINDVKLPEGVKPVDKENFTMLSITARVEESDKPAEGEAAAATPAK